MNSIRYGQIEYMMNQFACQARKLSNVTKINKEKTFVLIKVVQALLTSIGMKNL